MRKFLSLAAISCTIIALTACGDDVTNVTENNVGVQSFESFKKLPDCTKDNQGEMAIATKEGLVYYCDDKEWKKLNGEPGKDGMDGKDGIDGKDGEAGAKGEQGKKGNAGDDGKNGKDGASCTVAELEDKTGYKVLCGVDSVGIVLNGKNGDNGTNGVNCELTDKGKGILEIKCGDKTEEIYKAVCGSQPYDPKNNFCFENVLYDNCNGNDYNPTNEKCVEGIVSGSFKDDRDDSKYKYVKIGKQTWMAENLKHVTENSYCNEEDTDCTKYGRYYTWAAAMGKSEKECGYGYECVGIDSPHQGVCPGGWHLPTIEEWEALKEFISKDQEKSIETVGYYLKTKSGWFDYGNGNDYYGFSALPAGRYDDSYFYYVGNFAGFWSATERGSNYAYGVGVYYYSDVLYSYNYDKYFAYSVRCVKD